jgi:KAP family P-loop domain
MADPTQNASNTDYLGYGGYADSLWTRIQAALNKDFGKDTLGDDPLVVGIFGEWGAGKSYLLKLLMERVHKESEQKAKWRKQDGGNGFELLVPVFFQPWKYEHEEHLLVPLVRHIFSALTLSLKQAESLGDKIDGIAAEAFKEFKAHLPDLVSMTADSFSDIVDDVTDQLSQNASTAVASIASILMKWGAKKIADKAKKKRPSRINTKLNFKNDGTHYYEIHQTLAAVTRPNKDDQDALKKHLKYPVHINFVIFIDDLDRCLPEKAVGTLELIKTVFNVESFAFVLALDDEVIERGIGHRYQAYNYCQ